MFKHSPSRNQRSKGVKIKQALQVCLLLAVCTWLLYQIKHSYDKKLAYDEATTEISENVEGLKKVIKLGRKDLPQVEEEEEDSKNEEQEDEWKNENEVEGDEGNKLDDDIEEDEGRGGGDDEIDEQDQERAEEEDTEERGDDFVDEEEKRRDQKEIIEDRDHKKNTQEAREDNYKGDDASSAVFREEEEHVKYSEDTKLIPEPKTKGTTANAETHVLDEKLDSNSTVATITNNAIAAEEKISKLNEDPDEVQNIPDDSASTTLSIPREEKEARTDLGTLPETDTVGRNSEDTEVE